VGVAFAMRKEGEEWHYTESQFTIGTFTKGFEISDGDTYQHRLITYGPPPSRITTGDEGFHHQLGV